jgi:glucokinase
MHAAGPCAIGLDVGGTKLAGGLVSLSDGRLLARRSACTEPKRGGPAVLADALALARGLTGEVPAGVELLGIGVAVCELVDLAGNVTSGHTVQWQGLPVRAEFERLAPAVVESDVRAHALAEATWGAGQGCRLFVFVTVGTGISSCLVQNGRPYAGAHGNALILSTAALTLPGADGRLQKLTALEEFASGPALVARYNALAGTQSQRAEEVIAAAEAGQPAARQVVVSAARALGASLGWLVNVLDPEAIIVGGGLGSAGGLYEASLLEALRQHIWAEASREVPVRLARLGPDAALAGAALAVAERVISNR